MAPHLLNRQLSTEVRTSLTRFRKSRTPRGGGRPSSLTADGLSGVSHIIHSHVMCSLGVVLAMSWRSLACVRDMAAWLIVNRLQPRHVA
ncbi:hypothetical protein HaLaN_15284 [Haematococcus lacustris]|uniref:Uncharacterized protein n=1 Tax=Haematococcus lacustris TaxID=44745 RepID=A0A699Z8H5_HAELA|nr:hypothetical protein HaLaN_15284 [Haematococcus lacustris]